MDENTLKLYEPRLYKLFSNSRKKNRLANAYLLYGDKNAPLKETAMYLAQSLGCEKGVFGCRKCPSCLRFKEGVRPDFVFIDGEYDTIKKEDISALEEKFSLSALEKNHHLTYVIHRIDNITEKAANALLKFLEEPKEGQIAFLTTYNLERVLKTIVSRSLTIRIDPLDLKKLYEQLLSSSFTRGKKEMMLNPYQAYLLTHFACSLDEAKEILDTDSSFLDAVDGLEIFLNDLACSLELGIHSMLFLTNSIKDTKCYNWLYQILEVIIDEVLLNRIDEENPLFEYTKGLVRYRKNLLPTRDVLIEAISHRQANLNPTLTIVRILDRLKNGETAI